MKNTERKLHLYNKHDIILNEGYGVYLYDTNGKKYLDFGSGIGVQALGYNNAYYNNALKKQIDSLMHTSNLFYNPTIIEAAEKILRISEFDKVFFTNSGTEAVEGAIKCAQKYAYNKKKSNPNIIAFNNSFHGRTRGALSATGKSAYRKPFEPLGVEVRFSTLNDIESVKKELDENTIAVIIEPIQGEGGINIADKQFLKELRYLCNSSDVVLIFDEIQCGMGRTGCMFAWQQSRIKPDIMTIAKAIGGGLPVGAFVTTDNIAANSLTVGDHGTTYGGNPLAGAAVCAVIDIFEKEKILDNVNEVGEYLNEELNKLNNDFDCITEHRGIGLMHGLQFNCDVTPIINSAIENGLILIAAQHNVIRFLPPLIIGKQHVEEMISVLRNVINKNYI